MPNFWATTWGRTGAMGSMMGSLLFYVSSSAGMLIFNKLALRELHLPVALCVLQMLFTVLVLLLVPSLHASIRFGSRRDSMRWARVIPPLFAIMLVSSMLSLKHASMGAVVVLRNIAPLPTMLIEAACGEKVLVDLQTVLALVASLGGVVLYARNDIEFSFVGLCWMMLNMVAAVTERLLQRHMIAVEPIDVSSQGMMLLNNGIGSLLLLPVLILFGEASNLSRFLHLGHRELGQRDRRWI